MRTYSVYQLISYLKKVIDSEEFLRNIVICGEVSDFRYTGQNAYFTLKDDQAQVSCIFFEYQPQAFIKDGDKVYCQGFPSLYVKGGKLNFIVSKIELAGEGEEYLRLLRLKEKLQKEGLFDKKLPFPKSIRKIGVVTSAEGAAIYDVISVATRRDKGINIAVYPVRVQGIGAEFEIADAIKQLDGYDEVDCILVTRGGGSNEDLSAFNTEEVARAVAECKKFIVSAVGHEIDYTLCDFAADLRMPTPSAAAEILTKNNLELKSKIKDNLRYLLKALSEFYNYQYSKLNYSVLRLITAAQNRLNQIRNMIISKVVSLQNVSFFNDKYNLLTQTIERLKSSDPKKILSLGYAKVYKNGKSVNSSKAVSSGDEVTMFFEDGKVNASII
ncbi:MAG TPA: exodeoxyribonuclease VII large subunit [Clostridia bacterium]